MSQRPERVDLLKWRRALRHPRGPSDPMVRHALLTLATWGNTDGGSMHPSIETIAVAMGRHRNSVMPALERAVREGWVVRVERQRRGPYGKPRYAYEASVPNGWADENDVEHPWEADPTWTSERQHRGRLKPRTRASATQPAIVVPQLAEPCPPIGGTVSPKKRADVPQSSARVPQPLGITSSGTSPQTCSGTSSPEGRALTRTTDARSATGPNEIIGAPDRRRQRLTAEAGIRLALVHVASGLDVDRAAEEARRLGYPVTNREVRSALEAGGTT